MTRAGVRELECFIAVADHLSFSKAAMHLHLSQPPLTRHIQSLEEKLETRLFDRNTHSVSLTEHGKLFLEDARSIIGDIDRAHETIRRARQGETSRLRLSFVGALLDERLIELIRLFRERHPDCQVQVSDLPPSVQLASIQAGESDGGFIGARPGRAPKDISFHIWRKEPLLLGLPAGHPLCHRGKLRWQDLKDLPWIMVSRVAAPAFRQQFHELVRKHEIAARVVQESDRVPAILTMVAAGSGVTIVPRIVERLLPKGIVLRELPKPSPVLLYTFAYRTRNAPPAMADFLCLLSGLAKD
jgi:DNA-binding transcriptional LysR family regulator